MTPAVEARHVHVRYGAVEALHDVDFTIPEGAFVSIIGPNGGGKTTLLSVLLGLARPTAGEARLLGEAPARLPAEMLGYIPQLKTLDRRFPALALELVATGLRRSWPWRIRRAERDVCLAAMARTRVEHLAMRPVSALSGGELQRLYLARCLVRRPRLLVLDEPAAGMDAAGEADLYHLLLDYQKETGATVMMITHDWEGARVHASHVVLLDRRLHAFGPPAEAAREERLLEVFRHVGHVEVSSGSAHHAS